MLMLGWQDTDPRRTPAAKLQAACAAYEKRFGAAPTLALAAPGEPLPAVAGLDVRYPVAGECVPGKSTFYVGRV